MSECKQIVIAGISSELGSVLATELSRTPDTKIIGTMRRGRQPTDSFPSNVSVVDNCDLTEPEACARVAAVVNDRFQGPFGFVHSVGDFWEHVPFREVGAEQALRMFESHVTTLYNLLQALIPVMQAAGGGSVIAFSCNSTRYSYPHMASFT